MVKYRAEAPTKSVITNIHIKVTGKVNNLILSNSVRVYKKQYLDLLDLYKTYIK